MPSESSLARATSWGELPIFWGHQAVTSREQASPGAVADSGLGVDVLDVVVDGLPCDDEAVGDLLVRQPSRNQPQHFHLTRGQPSRPVTSARNRMTGGTEH